jgi:membrane-associated phospholipid phosphatase
VASAFGVSLALLRFTPVFGLMFLFVAVWISLGAVIGRYHYALDVLMGVVTALAVFLACYRFLI